MDWLDSQIRLHEIQGMEAQREADLRIMDLPTHLLLRREYYVNFNRSIQSWKEKI